MYTNIRTLTVDQERTQRVERYHEEPDATPIYTAYIEGARTGPSGSYPFGADLRLLLIRQAWYRGLDLEALADGFGPGMGTLDDWSAIRDSTPYAKDRMLCAALNHLFGEED